MYFVSGTELDTGLQRVIGYSVFPHRPYIPTHKFTVKQVRKLIR